MNNSREDQPEETLIPPVLPTYARVDIAIDHGKGVYGYDEDGKEYLDFGCGIGVNNLGFCHPDLVQALTEQAGKVWHTSNMYRIPGQDRLAQRHDHEAGGEEKLEGHVTREPTAAAQGDGEYGHKQGGGDHRGQDSLPENLAEPSHFFGIKGPDPQPIDGADSFCAVRG